MLITMHDVKMQVNVDHDEDDVLLQYIAESASDIILDYLKKPLDTWQDADGNPDAVPRTVVAATRLVAAALYADREGANDPISVAVESLLMRLRDPAMA